MLSQTLESLGFTVHQEKSVFEPRKELNFLGFRLDSAELKERGQPKFDFTQYAYQMLKSMLIFMYAKFYGEILTFSY